MIVIGAFRQKGLDASAAQINDYIQHLNGWTSINGTYDFRAVSQRGVGMDAVIMDRWNAATKDFVVVSKPGGAIKVC